MKIIKLNAIASTNSFLKDLASSQSIKNFTTVTTDKQIYGRGQMQTKWVSEPFKNLTFSTFYLFKHLPISHQKYLNFAVSLSVFEVLKNINVPHLAIKWPNDILSEKQKICGILIENSLQKNNIRHTVIGIGLNVNQENFPADIPNATSIKKRIDKETELNALLIDILLQLRQNINLLEEAKYDILEAKYLSVLYKKNVPCMFINSKNVLFMGKIVGIANSGNLQIELENETIKEFGLKEVSFATF